jgi:hypothetical protein
VRARGDFLEGLLDLGHLGDNAARRGSFRQSIVLLGQSLAASGPGPLEGVDPNALVPAMKIALADGLLDDLNWLSADAAAVALYEIASALPAGTEKREVGRRVATYTYEGNVEVFAAVATRMALGSGKGLAGPLLRARVMLALELPSGVAGRVDAMALALASRRELAKDWIVRPARASLASRRLSSRLIERAASEAARRAAQGDPHVVRIFRGEGLARAYLELLGDREPLVWRHAAVARGLLSSAMPELVSEIEERLSPDLSPTEWRRAATSLGASIAHDPSRVTRRIHELLRGPVVERDYGVAGSLIWGLAHGAKFEPEAAEEIVKEIVVRQGSAIGEAFEEAAREEPSWKGTRACSLLRRDLRLSLMLYNERADDGWASLATELLLDLSEDKRPEHPVRAAVWAGLLAFASRGAREAHELAEDALVLAREQVSMLEVAPPDPASEERRKTFATLRDLDTALLESAILPNLLALERGASEKSLSIPAVEELSDRMCNLLLRWEADPLRKGERPAHPTIRLRRLRALIHLLDADVEEGSEPSWRAEAVHERWVQAIRTITHRLVYDPLSVLRRSLAAALARALEGLARGGSCDKVDAMLWAAWYLSDPDTLFILKDASKDPDVILLLGGYGAFVSAEAETPKEELRRRLDAFARLGTSLSGESSSREEALRAVLVRLSKALDNIDAAPSLAELAQTTSGANSPVVQLEEAAGALGQLVIAARRRLAHQGQDSEAPAGWSGGPSAGALAQAIDRVSVSDDLDLHEPVAAFVESLAQSVPRPIVELVAAALAKMSALPKKSRAAPKRADELETPLPAWIPARRTIGGFYILRPIGSGGVGSVFVAKRVEERHDPDAERFALKVPEYTAQAARLLSEADFLKWFQIEATALLTLPNHPNLARFVTFDLGAKPKPILVMELVDGVTLDHVIGLHQLATDRSFQLLDGVLEGLISMHAVGVGHLDVKPANVVLRRGEQPVLVDFGLAGRHIRPGCGSGSYGAPEVWGLATKKPAMPMPADVYAMACLAFELLSARILFDGDTETALVTAHLSHDGWPPPLRRWFTQKPLADLAQLLAMALRRDPEQRVSATAFRRGLAALGPTLHKVPWPFAP